MIDWWLSFGLFLCGALLVLALLGLGVSVFTPGIDRWRRRFFVLLFVILTLSVLLTVLDAVLSTRPDMLQTEKAIWYFSSLLIAFPMPMLTVYLLHTTGERLKTSLLFKSVLALWAVYFILLTLSVSTDFFFHIEADNRFVYGSWYPLLPLPQDLIMLLNLAGVIRRRKKLSRKHYFAFFVFLIPLTVTLLIHTLFMNLIFVLFGIILFAFSMFGIILLDQNEQYLRQQREIARQQASIMVLQMRPHFIYNTMTSIYYLCDQDPKKAQQVTRDFTTYLRKNFTAISSEHMIPFSEELEHTRAYLAVEQAQFEDHLFVDYETPHTLFRVPPLTLQPIVENAVKHGMDPDAEPLRISIRTLQTDTGSEIIVEDNGPGYEPADDQEPHIALKNIRQRLEMMCRGSMMILPREGGGTLVRVVLPDARL